MLSNFEEVGGAYCFLGICPSVCLFITHFDAQHNLRTVFDTVLKFLLWIPNRKKKKKKADTYFSFWQDYAPFLSYGPLKKYECNIVSKIFKKTIKARALKLYE